MRNLNKNILLLYFLSGKMSFVLFGQCRFVPKAEKMDTLFYVSPLNINRNDKEYHNALEHIYCGEVKHTFDNNNVSIVQKAGGCHYMPQPYVPNTNKVCEYDDRANPIPSLIDPASIVYKVDVKIFDPIINCYVSKGGKGSTFFPFTWSADRVRKEIVYAFLNNPSPDLNNSKSNTYNDINGKPLKYRYYGVSSQTYPNEDIIIIVLVLTKPLEKRFIENRECQIFTAFPEF